MPFEEYPYLKIERGKCLALSNDECEVLIEKQKKIYADLAQKHGLDVACLTMKFLTEFSERESGEFTEEQKIFLRRMIVATGIKEKDEDLEDKDIFRLMAQIGNSEKLKEWYEKSKSILDINDSLIAAARNGHAECVAYLIEKCGAQILPKDKRVALMWAASNGYVPCVAYLIEKCGAQILNDYKGDALKKAAGNGHMLCVEYLIEKYGAQISDESKKSAFGKAISKGHMPCVMYLIKECGAQISDDYKGAALELAALYGDAEYVRCLIEECGEQISDDVKGNALKQAASNGHAECVEHLIKKCGAQISDKCKGLALEYAAWHGYAECVMYLIEECGAQISDDGEVLLSAVKGNETVNGKHKEVVKILIRIPDFVISEAVLMLVLNQAIHCKDHDIIHLLALQNIGNEKPSNGNRYKTEDGKGWRFGMTEPLRRTLEQERYQQLKDDSSYYIAYSQYSTFIDEKLKEKPSEDFMFLKYFALLLPPELQEKILSYVYCSPLSYTPEQWKKTRTFGDIYLNITWPSLQLDQEFSSLQLDQQNPILFSDTPTDRRKRSGSTSPLLQSEADKSQVNRRRHGF